MKEFELKYGCNPNQKPAKIFMKNGEELPITILCGRPGFINFFVATDMLMAKKNPQWVPIKQSNANVTFGLGVPIGPKGARHGLQADSKR